MATYTIIGGDKKEYGPVTADEVRQWIADGRLAANSLARGENDTDWCPLATFPEFADAFTVKVATIGAPPSFAGSTDFAERDYELDLGGCISRGWGLLKNNIGLLLGSFMIYLLIEIVLGGLGKIPLIGFVFSLVSFFITGPLVGGLYYVYLQAIRNQSAQVGDVFAGFSKAFWQLFLGYIVPAL